MPLETDAVSIRLGANCDQLQAQLEGFKTRALRAAVPSYHRNLYATGWHTLNADTERRSMATLMLRSADSLPDIEGEQRKAMGASGDWVAIVAATPGHACLTPLTALEVALALAQAQTAAAAVPSTWLLTTSTSLSAAHAESWGLARSARAEVPVRLGCIDASTSDALTHEVPIMETEAVVHSHTSFAPRLQPTPPLATGLVRLHFHTRGAISNLFLEPLLPLASSHAKELVLHVHAVGLNFRDVLNVLGEYPGDPGPPGGDTSGVISAVDSLHVVGDIAFGLAHAPLASLARAAAMLLSHKPSVLTFEEACTLPVTWSTTHAALNRAGLRAGCSMITQAAAGGVGLKAIEYAQWVCAASLGTAGRLHKHAPLRAMGLDSLGSSRESAAFAAGAARLLKATRSYMTLNSLSGDFIAASFAALGEGGAFQEIGKRSIWASQRHAAAAACSTHCAIALDADMAQNPAWMHRVLQTLAARASLGKVASLPLQSFDMEAQHELAFRTLQSGLNTGKIVVRITTRGLDIARSGHLVTGGTSGLGLLTGRWLAQHGAHHLTLASRSGALAQNTATQGEVVRTAASVISFERCDTSEGAHVRRLVAIAAPVMGVWHAAGVLADGVVTRQGALSLAVVNAPKAHGARLLRAACDTIDVRTCTLFSSVFALLGGAGQTNYAAANTGLDALAASSCVNGRTAISVQWGAWAEIGMAARGAASKRMAEMEAALGFGRIGLAQGLAVLGVAMRDSTPMVLAMLPITWSRFLSGGAAVPTFLSAFAPKTQKAVAAGDDKISASSCTVSLDWVLELVKRVSGGVVNADAPLMEAGVDSLGAVELTNQLQRVATGPSLPSTIVFDHPTARLLASLCEPSWEACAESALRACASSFARGLVAVCGLSALAPAGVTTVHELRSLLACGYDAISQVPATRWDVRAQPALPEQLASRVRHGGFVCGAELVDNLAFTVSPAEAAAMDPCQRLLLESGYVALHAADMKRTALSGSLTGVFLAFGGAESASLLAAAPVGSSVYMATGTALSIASGRTSYTLGLHGPCVSYDTACSAALVACHAGLRTLQLNECVAGLIMGTTLMLTPGIGTGFAVAGMTSSTGRSHTFDVRADGYARGEACCGLALSGCVDKATLCLLGSAVRQDGRTASLTAPSGKAQQGLLVSAMHDASTADNALALEEAHGTGTSLGDPIEMNSLAQAVLMTRQDAALVVGGVKAGTGHAEQAAGIMGLLKLIIGLRAGEASANARLRVLNPHVYRAFCHVSPTCSVGLGGLAVDKFAGAVSSFGYSGTIAHTALAFKNGRDYTVLLSEQCAAVGCGAFAAEMLVLRQRRFQWCNVLSSSAFHTAYMLPHAVCWIPLSCNAVAPPSTYVLCAQSTTCTFAEESSWHTLLVLLHTGVSASPCLHAARLALALTQLLAGHNTAVLPNVLMLTCRALECGGGRAASDAAHGGAWGFARVVRIEHSVLYIQITDVTLGPCHAALSSTLAPLLETELTWRRQRRWAARLRPCTVSSQYVVSSMHGVCAITGGLGGLGLRSATQLAAKGIVGVMLSSRGGHVLCDGQNLNGPLVALGTAVTVARSDAGDAADAFTFFNRQLLSSILHAAGMLSDKLLRLMPASNLSASFAPKGLAASHVHTTTLCTPLEALGLFSSISSTFGNFGQGNYAAANAYLDALASCQRENGFLATSLQIPAVRGSGMGASTFSEQQLNAMGAISLDEFAAALMHCLIPALASAERVQACLAPESDQTNLAKVQRSERALSGALSWPGITLICEEEALIMQQKTSLPLPRGQLVRLKVADRVAIIELHDPVHFNTLSVEMASDMQAAAQWLAAHEYGEFCSLVLQGAGEHFCPGGNLHRMTAVPTTLAAGARASLELFDGFYRLHALPMPVICAAHGAVLGGGLAICLLTDYVTCSVSATFQVGERLLDIYPAGLLSQTLADVLAPEVALQLYLTNDKLTSTQAYEIGLVQGIASNVQWFACNLAHRYALTTSLGTSRLSADFDMLSDESMQSDRQLLAVAAFAQARSMQHRALSTSATSEQVIFRPTQDHLVSASIRKVTHATLSSAGDLAPSTTPSYPPKWRERSYTQLQPDPVATGEDALKQLVQMLSGDQRSSYALPDAEGSVRDDVPAVEQRADLKELAAEYAHAFLSSPAASPIDALMAAYDNIVRHSTQPSSVSGAIIHSVPQISEIAPSCLLLCRKVLTSRQPPLIIAHSLLGDHKGYGQLWNAALHDCEVYAFRHQGLATTTNVDMLQLDSEAALNMPREYASVAITAFASNYLSIIGASFGAVLASHVACALLAAAGRPHRLILVDPPPVVPSRLPRPKMVHSFRTAAMGVLLIYLQIEIGASVWRQFPQLQTLPEHALPCFVAAQCLPIGASKDNLAALAQQFHRLLSVYRQCRYNFHVFSTSINSFSPAAGITPSILMALSNERWPTFCEMFPGIKEDVLEDYGLAVQLKLPGKHIAMINRCLGNRDATFTGAIKRCVNAIKTRRMPDFCAILTPILSHAYVLTAGSCEIPLQMCGGGPSTCQSHMRL